MYLIVDDEPFIRMHLCDIAESVGLEGCNVPDADAAMEMLIGGLRPSVLVTDVDMPGSMTGLELARAVRLGWPDIRIVVVSGRLQCDISGFPSGAIYIPKPFDERRIADALLH